MNDKILTFFFGSPFSGFSAFPPEYSSWVSGFDTKKSDFPVICKYLVKNNKTIFQYVEYNLSDDERSGRNFGIWLQIENYKLKRTKEKEVLEFIKDFVNEVLEEKEVFFKKGKKPHFYIIKSFKDVETDNVIDIFNEEFLKHYGNKEYLTKIRKGDFIVKDLITYDKPKKSKTPISQITTPSNDVVDNVIDKKENKKEEKVYELKNISKKNIICLIGFLLNVMVLFTFWNRINSIDEKFDRLNSQKNIPVNNSYNNTPVIKEEEEPKQEIKEVKKTEKQEQENTNKKQVIVKSGDNLKQIVIKYNKLNNTKFSTKQIADYNKIKGQTKKGKNGKNYIDYTIHPNDIIKFP